MLYCRSGVFTKVVKSRNVLNLFNFKARNAKKRNNKSFTAHNHYLANTKNIDFVLL